jgi:hypothetical protein
MRTVCVIQEAELGGIDVGSGVLMVIGSAVARNSGKVTGG